MGCHQAKIKEEKQITESQIKIKIERLKQFAILKKDQDISKILEQEQQLNLLLKSNQRNKDQEYILFSKLSQQIKYLETINFIIVYCQLLSDQVLKILKCQGNTNSLQELMIYIESVIYASEKLNLKQAEEFNLYFLFYFKLDVNNLRNVNPKIIQMFQSLLPNSYEINDYAKSFANKYGISEIELNQVGHQFILNNLISQQINNSNNFDFQQKNPFENLKINDENKNNNFNTCSIPVKHNKKRILDLKN
ncbi:unnamed protein product [Paramecium primaurelia]|uniref:Uncharacterized protein n=1 Tax=Paramecium primaurelia TaxID=5886 RepID=A0A8S1LJG0_PARPR|nr:unnamed protein product [Paramecium primaurelia]